MEIKPPRSAGGEAYIEHEVRPTDTLQGICLTYRIPAARLKMENHFMGGRLPMAAEKIRIPVEFAEAKQAADKARGVAPPNSSGACGHEEEEVKINTTPSKEDDARDPFSPISSPFRKSLEEEARVKGRGGATGEVRLTTPSCLQGSLSQPKKTDGGGEAKEDTRSKNEAGDDETDEVKLPTGAPAVFRTTFKAEASQEPLTPHHRLSGDAVSTSSSTEELLEPYELQRRSSEARLNRLELRRRQSSDGKDTNRLYRAHEAGLTITPGGSARRSLTRMGLPAGKGRCPPLPLSPAVAAIAGKSPEAGGSDEKHDSIDIGDPYATIHVDDLIADPEVGEETISQATFERALAKMDERAIRRIEKEERAKQKKGDGKRWSDATEMAVAQPDTPQPAGCISPFGMSILRNMFASKQSSFRRGSSSYSRYDSFLSSGETDQPSGLGEPNLLAATGNVESRLRGNNSTSVNGVLEAERNCNKAGGNDDIFRPTRRHSVSAQERLKNLLINAGFKDGSDDDLTGALVVDAQPGDDADILMSMSTRSMNSVAMLLKSGGPSYRDAGMFRGRDLEEEESTPKTMNMKTIPPVQLRGSSFALEVEGGENDLERSPVDASSPGSKKRLPVEAQRNSLTSSPGSKPAPIMDIQGKESVETLPSMHSDIGELASLLPPLPVSDRLSQSAQDPRRFRRSSTTSIMKSSLSLSSSSRKAHYKRSVSWGHRVLEKDAKAALVAASQGLSSSGLSVISFPSLGRSGRATSIQSNSIASLTSAHSLGLGAPLRSESLGSLASSIPTLFRAHPVYSPRPSINRMMTPPLIGHAHSIRSESATLASELDEMESFNSDEYVDTKPSDGDAWLYPSFAAKKPPLPNGDPSSIILKEEHPVYIHPSPRTRNYEGFGIEVAALQRDSIDNLRKYRSMVSMDSSAPSLRTFGDSFRSYGSGTDRTSRRNSSKSLRNAPPVKAIDDNFIIKNIHFERHSSEILRSLSHGDLYSSHHLETIDGGFSKGGQYSERSPGPPFAGDALKEGNSWDLEGSSSYHSGPPNAWGVLEDEYVEGHGVNGVPFRILGTSADDKNCHPHVLSPPLMESLQQFLPQIISNCNFWLKYSLVRDGSSLSSLLRNIRGTKHSLIAIETVEGEVFGSFTSSPWRKGWECHRSGEWFLWRMQRSRADKDAQFSVLDQAKLESELDVFYWTGVAPLVQYCTHGMIAVGGGEIQEDDRNDATEADEWRGSPREYPTFDQAAKGVFGLSINSALLRGTSSSCETFQSPPLSKTHKDGSPFEILNIEVWTLTPCPNVADAENLEMKTSFLEAYSREI